MTTDHSTNQGPHAPRPYLYSRVLRWEEIYMAVSVELIEHVIEVLRAYVGQWTEEGLASADDSEHALLAATCSALGSLIAAHGAHYNHHGVRELVLQIQEFLQPPPKAGDVEWLRGQRDMDPRVLDTLLAFNAEAVMRRMQPRPEQDS